MPSSEKTSVERDGKLRNSDKQNGATATSTRKSSLNLIGLEGVLGPQERVKGDYVFLLPSLIVLIVR